MLALAWILAVAGLIVAYVISLAGAMSTVPQPHWRDALAGVPLPLIAGVLAAWGLIRSTRAAPPGTEPPWISASIPLVLALLTLLLLYVSYFDQPGGPM